MQALHGRVSAAGAVAAALMVAASMQAAADSTWSQEYAVEYSSGSNYTAVGVWANKDGRVAVTWSSVGGGQPSAWVRTYSPNSGWTTAAQVTTNLAVIPIVHAAAWTPQGTLWIAYDSSSPIPDLNTILYDPGKGFSALETFGPARNEGVQTAKIVVDGSGNLLLAWTTQKASNGLVLVSVLRAGGPAGWGAPVRLDNASGQVRDLDVAAAAHNEAAVIWSVDRGNASELWMLRTSVAALAPFVPSLLRQTSGTTISDARILVPDAGPTVAAWVERDIAGGLAHLKSVTFSAAVNSSVEVEIAASAAIYNTGLTAAGGAVPIVVWEQSHGTGWVTCYSVPDGRGRWTRPAALHEAPGSSHSPRIALDPSGGAFAVWSAVDNGALSVWGREYRGGWLPATRLSQGPHPWFDSPRIAVDGRGAAWAVWTDGSPQMNWVLARAAGLPSGEEVGRTDTGGSGGASPLLLVVPVALAVAAVAVTYGVWRRSK